MNWEAVAAFSTAVTAVVAIVASAVTLRQWRESLRSRHLQGALGLIQQIESRSARSTRRFLRRHHQAIRNASTMESPYAAIERAVHLSAAAEGSAKSLDTIRDDFAVLEYGALLALNDMVPSQLTETYLLPLVMESWPLMEPIITATRSLIETDVYLQHFEAVFILASSGDYRRRRARRAALAGLRNRSSVFIRIAQDPVVRR